MCDTCNFSGCNTCCFNPLLGNKCSNICGSNMASTTPANIYQKQKIIQKTVRLYASEYIMNLGSLNVYENPLPIFNNVNWNQMSDRKTFSIQRNVVPSTKSTKSSYTRNRPGSLSPGGEGCDIKHNSYNRYLLRIKGKGPLRRGIIPEISPEIPFNRAFPVYGGKTFKTNIVSGYNCPVCDSSNGNKQIYQKTEETIFNAGSNFYVGDIVSFSNDGTTFYPGKILEVLPNNNYLVVNVVGVETTINASMLYVYPKCLTCTNNSTNECNSKIIQQPFINLKNIPNCNFLRWTEDGRPVL